MKSLILSGAVACVFALAPLAASASDDPACTAGDGPAMTDEALIAKVTEQGYEVRSTKMEDGCFEVKGVGPDGKRVELYLNPITGDVVKEK